MKIIVQKYGGSSLANSDRIRAVAKQVLSAKNELNQLKKGEKTGLVVVVSAMGGTTDQLLDLAGGITLKSSKNKPNNSQDRALGLLLSTGETVSAALLSLALQNLGHEAIALNGRQSGIYAEGSFTDARISKIDPAKIKNELSAGKIVIVTGYQGYNDDAVAVLGRGGSDASAVALAVALEAESCQIFSDVPGVLSTDPRVEAKARIIPYIGYGEMIELASAGAGVMMPRAVEIARKHNLPVYVGSSFTDLDGNMDCAGEKSGTWIVSQDQINQKVTNNDMERLDITGIASHNDIAIFYIDGIEENVCSITRILGLLESAGINIRLMTSLRTRRGGTNLSLVIQEDDLSAVSKILSGLKRKGFVAHYSSVSDVAQVSIVGFGIAQQFGMAFQLHDVLTNDNIKIMFTSTSEIKISVVIPEGQSERAVKQLHQHFYKEMMVEQL